MGQLVALKHFPGYGAPESAIPHTGEQTFESEIEKTHLSNQRCLGPPSERSLSAFDDIPFPAKLVAGMHDYETVHQE